MTLQMLKSFKITCGQPSSHLSGSILSPEVEFEIFGSVRHILAKIYHVKWPAGMVDLT